MRLWVEKALCSHNSPYSQRVTEIRKCNGFQSLRAETHRNAPVSIKKQLQPIRETVYKKLFTKSAKELWKAIQDSNPHEWHLKGTYEFMIGNGKSKK